MRSQAGKKAELSLMEKGFLFLIFLLDIYLQIYFKSRGLGNINHGISFGLFSGYGQALAILIFLIFSFFFFRSIEMRKNGPLWFIFFGALGNLLPRLFGLGVWDYIHTSFLPFWFNLSDVVISFGVISYILGINGNSDSLRG